MIICPQVTTKGIGKTGGVPATGDEVSLSTAGEVIGDLTTGHSYVVDANAVAPQSVPRRCIVAGVPARILHEDSDARDAETW